MVVMVNVGGWYLNALTRHEGTSHLQEGIRLIFNRAGDALYGVPIASERANKCGCSLRFCECGL